MTIKGAGIAYAVIGGVTFYSGIKGSSLSATVKSVLSGNLSVSDSEKIGTPTVNVGSSPSSSGGSGGSGAGSAASSGTASANYLTIGKYLLANGYSAAGAAGVVGCVAGESSGNPEASSPGAIGLIQWTGSNESMVPPLTGNATKDLDAQLPAIIAYNNAQGAGLVQMLNAISDPVAAADFYSQNFERPAVKDSDVVASVADTVYHDLLAPTPAGTPPPNITETG
jgi:hypothetical protein